MDNLKSIYGRFQKFAVLSVLFVLLVVSSASAQQTMRDRLLASNGPALTSSKPAEAAPAPTSTIDPSRYGTFETNKYYISNTGVEFKVGDTITLGTATRIDGKFYNIRYAMKNSHNTNDPNTQHLGSEYSGQKYEITGISECGYDGKNGPKNVYLFFRLPASGLLKIKVWGEITVVPALDQQEFKLAKVN